VQGGSSLSSAFDTAFWVAVGATVLGVGISFVLPSGRSKAAEAAPAPVVPAAQPERVRGA
ncbi:hypothetical protein AB4144_63825, partial [Rhizobiaceae sp. 2RAB30]